MSYCIKCGKEIVEGSAFCNECGTPIEKEIPTEPVENEVSTVTEQPQDFDEKFDSVESEFLENTRKLLRWEYKAWNIAAKVWIICGIIYAAIFSLYTLLGVAVSTENAFAGGFFMGFGIVSTIFGGSMFIGVGIVSKKAAARLPQYIDTVYTDFSISYKRCSSIGMLVFNVILGVISPIFFIINFVRMKVCRNQIETIMKKQNVQ
jgi:hypothetical protein